MFITNKAQKLLTSISHQGRASFAAHEYQALDTTFTANSFQICFEFSNAVQQSSENLVILEQLLRFEEVLPYREIENLSFREFESFLRDENSKPSVSIKDSAYVNKLFNQWKQAILPAVRVKKSLELQLQICKSVNSDSFIHACVKIERLFSGLIKEGYLTKGHFEIFELDLKKGDLVFLIFVDAPIPDLELEIIKVIGESIDGIRQIKMTLG